jgi:hypothetical protein
VSFEVVTRGLHELRALLEDVKVKVDPVLGKALSGAAEAVKADVKRRAAGYGAPTVAGVHIRRRGTVVRVQQDARKTTRMHPEFGAYQQRNFFDPALADNQDAVVALTRVAMDELSARVNGAP